jgi:hypothetical protein
VSGWRLLAARGWEKGARRRAPIENEPEQFDVAKDFNANQSYLQRCWAQAMGGRRMKNRHAGTGISQRGSATEVLTDGRPGCHDSRDERAPRSRS